MQLLKQLISGGESKLIECQACLNSSYFYFDDITQKEYCGKCGTKFQVTNLHKYSEPIPHLQQISDFKIKN